jgi:hypothetical protein
MCSITAVQILYLVGDLVLFWHLSALEKPYLEYEKLGEGGEEKMVWYSVRFVLPRDNLNALSSLHNN